MGDQIASTASKLVPLLLVLVAVFGALIVAAVLLRWKVRAESAKLRAGPKKKGGEFERDDVVSVLGRMFNVTRVSTFETAGKVHTLLELEGQEEKAKVVFSKGAERAMYFPGRLDFEGGDFPEVVNREGREFVLTHGPVAAEPGRLAIYSAGEFHAMLIEGSDGIGAWKGKDIPAEGIEVVR
ncbi:MAG: hypothetical protein D6806_15480 [Deltaproteobacteria bacterium]|nr:MAG: hypothetical protein D6806_15480 [Deltaproteobacteria bacterium]